MPSNVSLMTELATGKPTCVIVDGYSSGRHIAPACFAMGCQCIHVKSSPEIHPGFTASYRPQDFVAEHEYEGNFESLLGGLRSYNVRFVVAGVGSGICLADRIAEELDVYSNGTASTELRTNKFAMYLALAAAGLVPKRCTERIDGEPGLSEILASWESYPAVLKPTESDGSHALFICRDESEIRKRYDEIARLSANIYGIANFDRSVLLQKCVEGREYVAHSFSLHGQTKIGSIWQSTKRDVNDRWLRDYMDLILPDDEPFAQLAEYVRASLEVVNLHHGPANSDIVLGGQGPFLLEVNPRLAGRFDMAVFQEVLGMSPALEVATAFLNPDRFLCDVEQPYVPAKHARAVSILAGRKRKIDSPIAFDGVRRLPSFFDAQFAATPNSTLEPSTDLSSFVGMIYLVHESVQRIEQDHEAIRSWEKREFL